MAILLLHICYVTWAYFNFLLSLDHIQLRLHGSIWSVKSDISFSKANSFTKGDLNTYEFKIHWYFRKLTDIVWHPLYIDCTSLFLSLTSTVSHCTLRYISTEHHCIPPYGTVQSFWLPMYPPPPRKPLYRALISTVTHCTVCHSTINLKSKIVLNIFSMIIFSIFIFNYDVYSIYIVKNSTSRQN